MRRPLLACLALALSSGPALAQTSAEGSLRGHVKDQHGAVLPGVALKATSPTVPGEFTAVSDAGGYYRLLGLPPGEYTVTAELAGFAKLVRDNVDIRTGLNLGLELTMKVGAIAETVEVRLETPMLESTTAVQGVNISGEFQRSVPLSNRRHWSDFLALTPGVATQQSAGRTADSFTLRGATFDSHVIQIDGADMASTQQNATSYVHFATEAIEDVQVKTGGVDASAPLGFGAVMNIATKSGTNDFRGALNVFLQKKGWSDSNTPGGTSATLDTFLPEAALGGPIIPDRVWFFGSYRYERILAGVSRSANTIALLRALKPGFEPFDRKTTGHHVFAKVTAEVSPKHRAELSYWRDPQNQFGAGEMDAEPGFERDVQGGNFNMAARVSSVWGPSVTTRFGASYNDKRLQIFVRPDIPARQVHESAFLSAGQLRGNGIIAVLDNANAGQGFDQPYTKATMFGDLTYLHTGWVGSHEFQAGFQFQPKNHERTNAVFSNGGFKLEELVLRNPADPAAGLVPFHREVYDVAEFPRRNNDTRDLGLYVQDAWRPSGRLTVNAGVRVDIIKRVDRLFDVVVQDSTDVGPRLGINYMLTADQKNALRASWVRVHGVLSNNVASAGTSTAGKRDLYDNDLDGVFETVFVTPAVSAAATDRIIDLDRGQPYINEASVGYRRQLPGSTVVDVGFVRREYRKRSAVIEVNGIYEDGVFKGYRDENFNEIGRLTSNTWNWPVYTGLELQVTKQTSRVQLLGAYTRGWRHIAGTWVPNDPASFIQPDAFPNDRTIGDASASTASFADSNSLSGTHMTTFNPSWIDHVARLGLLYHAPFKLDFATNYTFQSGQYSGPVVTRIAAADPRFGPARVTLSNGRIVSNPLATTIRFAYPTRGEGQLQRPDTHLWNLRAGRTFDLGQQRALHIAVDVFNVTNSATDQAFLNGGNQMFSSNFGVGRSRLMPRSAAVSARLSF
jgi:hypothetical protein